MRPSDPPTIGEGQVMDVTAPWYAIGSAFAPLVLLTALVLARGKVTRSAWLTALLAAALGLGLFGASPGDLVVSWVRGAWTALWILLIVLPALLLFEVLDRSGALDRLAEAAATIAPTEGRRLLLIAWILPSFLQGAAGFGAPAAMAAPMLVRSGMAPVAAVAACLVGYQWAVTFGSMGSSYFMAEATAQLTTGDARSFALRAGVVLAITALVSGLLVLSRGKRSPGDLWRTVVLGAVMGATLVAVVIAQPALGSTAAGLAGLLAAWWVLPGRGAHRPRGTDALVAALPYLVLATVATAAFGIPPVRDVLARLPEIAPVLPGIDAAYGHAVPAGPVTPTLRPLLHPLPYVALAIVAATIAYRRRGWWSEGTTREATRSWYGRARNVTLSITGLTVLAALLADTGMIALVAQTLADTLGHAFVLVSAPIGVLGTVVTGSTTASNALFSSLQAEVAVALTIAPAVLVTGQTAGGNVGSAIAPAVASVGTAAVDATGREGEVIRANLGSAAVLTLTVLLTLVVQVWLLR